jgi:hypothetical protein
MMKRLLSPVVPWAAWVVSTAITILCWAVLRTALVAIADAIREAVVSRSGPETGRLLGWAVAAVDPFAVFGLGVVGLGLVLIFDSMYRKAHAGGRLWRRFSTVTGVQAGVLVFCSITLAALRALRAA